MLGGVGDSVRIYLGRKYTPLYEKGIKKDQNKSMETTILCHAQPVVDTCKKHEILPLYVELTSEYFSCGT